MFQGLLEKMALALEAHAIPYMVIGGQAVLIHGEPRLTQDIDVTLGAGAERADEIVSLAESHNWKILVESPLEFVQRTMVLPCLDRESGIRLDIIFSDSAYEREALSRCVRLRIGSAEVRFASPEDLIIHKLIAGRPRDLEDARSVLEKGPNLDLGYVRRWLIQFEPLLSEPLVARFEEIRRSP